MGKKAGYYLSRDVKSREITYIEYSSLEGFNIKPKGNQKYLQIDQIVIINPSFTRKVIKKRLMKKLNNLILKLKYLLETDDDSSDDVTRLLDECERLKIEAMNNYIKYLDREYIAELFSKINLIYDEIRKKYYSHEISSGRKSR